MIRAQLMEFTATNWRSFWQEGLITKAAFHHVLTIIKIALYGNIENILFQIPSSSDGVELQTLDCEDAE